MKTINELRISKLMIYPQPKEVISKVNKIKGLRHGAVVMLDPLPKANGQSDNFAIELSDKQLDNLAAGVGINKKGRAAWSVLQIYLLRGAKAVVSSEEHKAGDTYTDTKTGQSVAYTESSVHCTLDGVILPGALVKTLQDKAADKSMTWADEMEDYDSAYEDSEKEEEKKVEPAVTVN